MSFLPFLLQKLILLAFCLSWGSNKPLGPILCHHFQNCWLQAEYATY